MYFVRIDEPYSIRIVGSDSGRGFGSYKVQYFRCDTEYAILYHIKIQQTPLFNFTKEPQLYLTFNRTHISI